MYNIWPIGISRREDELDPERQSIYVNAYPIIYIGTYILILNRVNITLLRSSKYTGLVIMNNDLTCSFLYTW